MALRSGDLARLAGVNTQTLRYYERRKLLPKPRRTDAGYRLYDDDAVRRIRFIKKAQYLGFTLEEILDLLTLRANPDTPCIEVRDRAVTKIDEVADKIRDLQRIKRALTKVAAQCTGQGPVSDCPILDVLESEDGR